jgi:hypothetical protein
MFFLLLFLLIVCCALCAYEAWVWLDILDVDPNRTGTGEFTTFRVFKLVSSCEYWRAV